MNKNIDNKLGVKTLKKFLAIQIHDKDDNNNTLGGMALFLKAAKFILTFQQGWVLQIPFRLIQD